MTTLVRFQGFLKTGIFSLSRSSCNRATVKVHLWLYRIIRHMQEQRCGFMHS